MTWIPVSQIESEFVRLLEIFDERQPQRILEIGVAFGGTLHAWIERAQSGASVFCVDLFEHDGVAPDLFQSWREDVTVVSFQGDSTAEKTIREVRPHGPFDWVFIDGSHAFQDVRSDWLAYGGMVEHGVVAFHDIAEHTKPGHWSEVGPFWEAVKTWGETAHGLTYRTEEIIAEPAQGWGGIGVVYIDR